VPTLGLVALVTFYVALKSYQLNLSDSDENIYFYMALRTAFGGLLPYRDYFFAHPPLHLAFAVVALELGALVHGASAMLDPAAWGEGGAALVAVKSIGVVAGVVGGLAIHRAVRRVAGAPEAWLAAAFFLLSPDLLHSFFTGIAEALMLAAVGLERVVAGRDRQAGLAFAGACLVATYAAPCGLAVWLVLVALAPRRARTLALWTAAPLLIVHGAFLLWAGRPYWEQVFVYHLHKPKSDGVIGHELWLLVRKSSLLVMAVPAALTMVWHGSWDASFSRERLRAEPRVQVVSMALVSLVATMLFVALTRAVFHYYFVMLMLGLAPLAGLAYGELIRRAVTLARSLRSRPRRAVGVAALASLLVWPLVGTALARLPAARRTQIPDNAVGRPMPRTWRPSPLLGPLDGAVHALLWRDEEVLGRAYPIWTRFLWDASPRFEMAYLLAGYARRLPPEATVFGDATLMTAVALLSGHHVSLDEADTNDMRFRSGVTKPEVFGARLRAAPPALIAFPVGELLVMGDVLPTWLQKDYESDFANDADGQVYYVMRPRGAAAATR
jgi:hypothetical protein